MEEEEEGSWCLLRNFGLCNNGGWGGRILVQPKAAGGL
jgi:hypothetical protein